ncbi:hypothetical protein Pmani_003953 [Petrolisthes manimaculis]|uniref:Endonuclease/exonuclease/phosphatase domain-containing protein n=1 Tax=Petrolisthes manimaculis TaxID=1843537 RepID=A0AAE1UHZ6_9EUCA|nr:hypothetical protein Pmani_003949 [Petrolisthes manimaculis]KAK4325501.1 hypothetical protein Pmani_003951 [Petrolisthes manimaculis]KAK4325503.1 hypothetical protein Pmani_003953 [Petrolisthes manimaculis]
MAVEENLLFLALTETHLTYEHLNAEINMNHYSVYRADRQDPTRERNILDLIFSNNPNLLHSYEISDTIMSDHKLIKVKASISTTTTPISHVQNSTAEGTLSDLNFYSTEIEWEQLRTKLGEIDWINTMQGKDIDNILSLLTKICYETYKKHIPKKTKKRTNTSKIPRDRKIIMIKRHKLQTKLKNTTYPPVRVQITEKLRELEEQMQ